MPARLPYTGNDEADELISTDPLALLVGFALDQQVTVQKAFSGPLEIRRRLGSFDARQIAAMDPAELDRVFRERPAIHRFPGSMGKRTYALCRFLTDEYGGDAAAVWTGAATGADLLARVQALPGFGEEKAKIFVALLAKRFGVRPEGWEAAAAPFSDATPRSVADIDSADALEQVRAWKKAQKAAGKSKRD